MSLPMRTAVIENGLAQLLSRNDIRSAELGKHIAASVPNTRLTVLDYEIVCAAEKGKPQFRDLLFHRGYPMFLRVRFADGRPGAQAPELGASLPRC